MSPTAKTGLVAFVCVFGLATIVGAVVMLTSSGGDSPVPFFSGPSDDWTLDQLADYLHEKGVKFEVTKRVPIAFQGPYIRVSDGKGEVFIQQLESPQKAKDMAGANGKESFSRGRFYIHGEENDSDLYEQIKKIIS